MSRGRSRDEGDSRPEVNWTPHENQSNHLRATGDRGGRFGVAEPEPPRVRPVVDFSGRKTRSLTSNLLPRYYVDDGPTGWIL